MRESVHKEQRYRAEFTSSVAAKLVVVSAKVSNEPEEEVRVTETKEPTKAKGASIKIV